MKDFVGRTINIGDTVVYPVRRKSEMYLKRLRVDSIQENPPRISGYDPVPPCRRTVVKNIENCIVEVPLG